ncbi:MAG TPA: sialidase family protein [Gemmatimonadales bacterium]|nr:sialidase family protein [Gemmatimonadales bacterium]
MRRLMLLLLLGAEPSAPPAPDFQAPEGSAEPFLTATPSGGLLATWFEPRDGERRALRIAERRNGRWSTPLTVAERDDFFVNWADFPSAVETADGRWVVHWLQKTATRSYAYHIQLVVSADRGKTWSPAVTPHTDRSATEHGFVAMAPRAGGGADLLWLDGRQTADSLTHGPMAVVAGAMDRTGWITGETMLDRRTCDCCQTALARTSEGLLAVYRDRSDDEVRDISAVRQVNGRWTDPVRVAADGWVYKACPVNGPAVAAIGRQAAVAWFTGADGTPRVKLARSSDGGATFAAPIQVDDGHPLGRADIELLPDGSALVTWLEIVGDQAEWRIKRLGRDGRVQARWTVGSAPKTRQAGFARTALSGRDLFVAWTVPGPRGGVQIDRLVITGN